VERGSSSTYAKQIRDDHVGRNVAFTATLTHDRPGHFGNREGRNVAARNAGP
jgi:hypothetical protein